VPPEADPDQVVDIVLPLEQSEDGDARRAAVAAKLEIAPDRIRALRLHKHFIDARQRQIKVRLRLEAGLDRKLPPDALPRDPETLRHPEVAGFFPCGEGAGYAGGIVSAALDGMRCAEAACRQFERAFPPVFPQFRIL